MATINLPPDFKFDQVQFYKKQVPPRTQPAPLGTLAKLAGSFTGTGFNAINLSPEQRTTTTRNNIPQSCLSNPSSVPQRQRLGVESDKRDSNILSTTLCCAESRIWVTERHFSQWRALCTGCQ
jgi:hypothetical protein